MSGLEKTLIAAIVALVCAAVLILMIPDANGNSGFQLLSPKLNGVRDFFEQAFSRFGAEFAAWTNGMRSEVRQGSSSVSRGKDRGNPIDSAVGPVGSYGEAQKNVYGKPLEGLQR